MGDRVVITFTDDDESFSPAVYMHWNGQEAPDMIRAAQPVMRREDSSYSAARFCGECHKAVRGVTGLGLVDAPVGSEAFPIDWNSYSHGDAGVYVVNTTTGEVKCHGGYGEDFKLDPDKFAAG